MFSSLALTATLLLPVLVHATNDWTQPCFSGTCSYDVQGASAGSLSISGSQTAISDVTPAAGWMMLTCDPNQMAQDIRLVCQSDTSDAGCDHVYQNGAVGKIVRLPESCAPMPFARVSAAWDSEDQTIHTTQRRMIYRRDGSQPVVKAFSLDANWTAVDPSQNGPVAFTITGGGAPATSSSVSKRLGSFNHTLSEPIPPISFTKSISLFNTTLPCSSQAGTGAKGLSVNAGVDVSLDADVKASINFSVTAAGSLIPPKVSTFELDADLDGSLGGGLSIDASVTGTLDSGPIPVFTIGIPGLDFPGIFSLGPTFSVNAEATATLDAQLGLNVGLDFTLSGTASTKSNASTFAFSQGSPSIDLSASPNIASDAKFAAHIIPTLAFGINALDSLIEGQVELDFDTSLSLDLSLAASETFSPGKNASTAFSGCAELDAGLALQAGGDGDLLKLFGLDKTVNLFSKNFDLFKKCFGNSSRRDVERRAPILFRRALACPSANVTAPAPIANQTLSKS